MSVKAQKPKEMGVTMTLEEPEKIARGQVVAGNSGNLYREPGNPFFKKGHPGGGRPKGARQVLSEAFLKDVKNAWEEHGIEVIHRCIKECPKAFLTTVAGLLPKEITGENGGPIEVNNGALDALMRKLGALADKDLQYEAELELKAREEAPKLLPQPPKPGRDSRQ